LTTKNIGPNFATITANLEKDSIIEGFSMPKLTGFSQLTRLLFIAVLSIATLTACGSGSNFSGGNKKAETKKPQAAKKADATPAESPPKKLGKDSEDDKNDTEGAQKDPKDRLDDETITPPIILDDEIKLPKNTIVKGSFRVWTIPADPAPMEAYAIYIDVKLPSNTVNYSRQDLSGQVVGTDGYVQTIGRDAGLWGEKFQRFESFQGHATLIISVPGAVNLVKDTINIHSTLLNESQNIEIVF